MVDLSEHFNDPELSDVVLHVVTSGSSSAGADHEEPARSYYLSRVVVGQADFFKSLILRWTPALTTQACSKGRIDRMELQLRVAADKLEAFELLLRLMYGAALPGAAAANALLLVKAYAAADMYCAPHCTEVLAAALCSLSAEALALALDLLLAPFSLPEGRAHLAPLMAKCQQRVLELLRGDDIGQSEALVGALCTLCCRRTEGLDLDLVKALYSLAEGRAHLAPLMAKCQQRLVQLFGDVPSVITSDQLRWQFCSLPFAAVLAWLKADDLKVHSENCMVFLLSTWVASKYHAACPAAQLEELACHVRVRHLSPLYLQSVLPSLTWFSSKLKHLPHLVVQLLSGTNSVTWRGPPAWQAGPRTGTGLPSLVLDWEIGGAQLEQLYAGTHIFSDPLYANGAYCRPQAQNLVAAGQQPEKRILGLYLGLHEELMRPVLSGKAYTEGITMFQHTLEVKVPATGAWKGTAVNETWALTGLGTYDMLSCSGSTLKEAVASFLLEGKLLVRATGVGLG